MKKWILFTKIVNTYKAYREKKLIRNFIKRKKSMEVRKILKRKEYSKPFHVMLFDSLLHGFGKRYLKKYIYPKIIAEEKNQTRHQKKILHEILDTIKNTQIGQEYHIKDILRQDKEKMYESFSKDIPIFEYDTFKKYIQQSKIGKDIIRPGKITKFSASSGTTDNKKHIPVTSESLESSSKAGVDTLTEYVIKNPKTKIFKGDFFPLAGSIQEYENDITVADISALLLLDRGNITKIKYALDVFSLLHPEREIKREIALENINPHKPITMMGVTSRAYEILNYIQKRDSKMFAIMIKKMEVIIGGGVDVSPYMHYFQSLNLKYIGAYNASEGFFGYQDIINYDNTDGKSPYKLLINHGVFYEFIEFNSKNFDENGNCKKSAKAKPIREITKKDINKKYALVITANNGLIRYLMGDVLQFVDENKRFKITGRTRQSLNLKGEELMETHISGVINELSKTDDINIIYYTIGPDKESNPTRHERLIETEKKCPLSEEELAKKIDSILQKINADYEAKRKKDILLQLPKITLVDQGIFYQWLKKANRLGAQIKIPKLSSKRNYITEILKIAK